MKSDVEDEAPRPRPLSAGIWTLFSWLRRTDRSSSSESVTSVGSDRTVASFDFLAPLNYTQSNTPIVLPQDPLTDTYKKRLQERNLRRKHDRDLTLRRKYGLFTDEGLGYDAFSLPSARRLPKVTVTRQYRERRATSESIQRRTAYVPGKRRAPLPPAVVTLSATLPRTCKRKRPAPKPPVKLSEENKENVEINKITQMNPDISKHSLLRRDASPDNKSEKHSKHLSKEVKLRTDKSFLKHIFENRKRNSAIDTSHVKLLPSISELDKQAAAIIEASKSSRTSIGNNCNPVECDTKRSTDSSIEETWMCTTCLRKYKPVVKCCIYCLIKENSPSNKKHGKNISPNLSQTEETLQPNPIKVDKNTTKPNRNSLIEDKKKLREMLKEMKDSLPKRPKHTDNFGENGSKLLITTETPTLRIGSDINENLKNNFCKGMMEKEDVKKHAKEIFLNSVHSSSKQNPLNIDIDDVTLRNLKSDSRTSSSKFKESGNLNNNVLVHAEKETPDFIKKFELPKKSERQIIIEVKECNDLLTSSLGVRNNKLKTYSADNIKKVQSSASGPDTSEINETGGTKNESPKINLTNSGNLSTVESKNIPPKVCDKATVTQLLPQNLNPVQKDTDSANVKRADKKTFVTPIHKLDNKDAGTKNKIEKILLGNVLSPEEVKTGQVEITENLNNSKNIDLHTPLKISSLLNPLYCPKYKVNDKESNKSNVNIVTTKDPNVETNKEKKKTPYKQTILPNVSLSTSEIKKDMPSTSTTKLLTVTLLKSEVDSTDALKETEEKKSSVIINKNKNLENKITDNAVLDLNNTNPMPYLTGIDHHTRRRDLINQLEQAISKGDEQTAAEAAAKLAKLKLSCSVLSFSSQIVAEPSPNKTEPSKNIFITGHGGNLQTNPTSTSNVAHANSKLPVLIPDKSLIEVNTKDRYEDQKPTTTKTTSKESNIIAEPSTPSSQPTDVVIIDVWVEDKEATRGPIPLHVSRSARIGELKRQAETSLGLEIRLQRWIVGRTLCTDDNTSIVSLAGPDLNAPFYLCLVESETNKDLSPLIKENANSQTKTNAVSGDVYTELMRLEQQALVSNAEEFECSVCMEQCAAGSGVVLRECIHTFCKECLADVVRHCEEQVVTCPAIGCPGVLQDREIRALLSAEEHERWLARGLAAAENGTRNAFHCRTRDCTGWAFCEPGVRRFPCPVCKHTNCVACQAMHEGKTCEEYQATLREAINAAATYNTDEGTQALLKSLIARGEALECPECNTIITKKWGCDWVKCSACKTEICWITRGRRWGPGGKGDTSGGCRCGVDGIRCHPSCGYCH